MIRNGDLHRFTHSKWLFHGISSSHIKIQTVRVSSVSHDHRNRTQRLTGPYIYVLGAAKKKDTVSIYIHTFYHIYLRAAAPAADPGRIGKEAKQIGIKTLRCFAP